MTAWISSCDLISMPTHIIGLVKIEALRSIARFRFATNILGTEEEDYVWRDMFTDVGVAVVLNIFSTYGYRIIDSFPYTTPGTGLITYTWVMDEKSDESSAMGSPTAQRTPVFSSAPKFEKGRRTIATQYDV